MIWAIYNGDILINLLSFLIQFLCRGDVHTLKKKTDTNTQCFKVTSFGMATTSQGYLLHWQTFLFFVSFFFFFLKSSSIPNVGLYLLTLRSRATCSINWASQGSQPLANFLKNLYWINGGGWDGDPHDFTHKASIFLCLIEFDGKQEKLQLNDNKFQQYKQVKIIFNLTG